jgi:hypothetical protein
MVERDRLQLEALDRLAEPGRMLSSYATTSEYAPSCSTLGVS